MGSEWPTVPLGELVEMSADKIETKSIPEKCYVSTDSMLPDFGGVSFNRATPSVAKTSSFSKEDILFSNIRTYFRKLWIADRNGGCSNDVIVFRSKENVHPEFMFYSMMDERFIQHTVQTSKGTKMPRGDKSAIIQYRTILPPLPEQKAIAHILGTLDDKIELNRRMNATLEGMAQALFKSWFVDFDPVIDNALAAGNPIPDELAARAEVRRQALANGTTNREAAKPFPAAFQQTESMGWIPEGWEERAIEDCFQLLGGHSFKSGDYVDDGDYGVVTIKNVQDGSFVQNCSSRITKLPVKMKSHCSLNSGDVLLSLTGNVGRGCVVSDGCYVLNQRVSKIVGRDEVPEAFCYFYFRQKSLYERMITIAKGTAQQNLSPIETAKLRQAMPCNQTIANLSPHLDAIYKKMAGNISVSQTLSKLRDTLLPKLISGEIHVPNKEAPAHEVPA